MRKLLIACATLVFSTPVPVVAQSVADLCRDLQQFKVGQWVQLEMTGGEIPGGKAQMRLAIVGEEQAVGKEHYWLELKMNTNQGAFISQFLIPGYPYEQQDIQAMVMKMGDQPAVKMPTQMMGMMQRQGNQNKAMELAKECGGAQEIGWETVTVPAGAIHALHLKATDGSGEMWVTNAFPFGMVKWVGTKGEQMVLLGHGTDAKSSITETPMEMPGMGMRPPR